MSGPFCPQAVAWGDVATWFGAFAALATVAGALWLAKLDGRRRAAEVRAQTAFHDFRGSVLLLPAFSHLAELVKQMPERIEKLEPTYAESLRDAEDAIDIWSLRQMSGHADITNGMSYRLAGAILATVAWCRQFDQTFYDAYQRSTAFQLGTGPARVYDKYQLTDDAKSRGRLKYAAEMIEKYTRDAIVQMSRKLGESDGAVGEFFLHLDQANKGA